MSTESPLAGHAEPRHHPGLVTSDDRGLQRRGRELLFAMAAALRSLQLYPLENQTVVNALSELEGVTQELLGVEEQITLRFVGDFFFVNDLRLRIDLQSYATYGMVGRALLRHGIGELEVFQGVTVPEWTALLALVNADPDPEDRFGAFLERLGLTADLHLAVGPDRESEPDLRDEESRRMAKRAYAQTVAEIGRAHV